MSANYHGEERWASALLRQPGESGDSSRMQSARNQTTSPAPSETSLLSLEGRATSSWTDVGEGPQAVHCEVLVIGAGVSGLTAAYEMLKRDPTVEVVVIEARDRVGGRTLSSPLPALVDTTEIFDLGAQWVASSQTEILNLLNELDIEIYPQYSKGSRLLQVGPGSTIRKHDGTLRDLGSWWERLQLQLFVWKVDRLAKLCTPLNPCRVREVQDLDGYSVETFIRENITSRVVLEVLEQACRVIWGCEPGRLSLVPFLTDIHSAGGLYRLLETSPGSAREFCVKGGTQQISEKLAERIGSKRVHLNEPVTHIIENDSGVSVSTSSGRDYHCKYVISSIPPNLLTRIRFHPPLQPDKRLILESMPMGSCIKFIVTYKEAFWRRAGLSGEIIANGGPSLPASGEPCPLCSVRDASSGAGSPALVGLLGGSVATDWQQKTRSEREVAVVDCLATFFGTEAKSYIGYLEKIWAEDEFSGGGPCCFTVPGVMRYHAALRRPHGSVFFCGAEMATRWTGYMNGASQSGREMAVEVLQLMRPGCLTVADLQLINRRRAEQVSTSRLSVEEASQDWVWRAAGTSAAALLVLLVAQRCLRGILGSRA